MMLQAEIWDQGRSGRFIKEAKDDVRFPVETQTVGAARIDLFRDIELSR